MPPSELRKEAREALAGKWGKGVCIILAYALISFILELVMLAFQANQVVSLVLSLLVLIISVPLSYGLIVSFMKLKRGDSTSAFDFLEDGFKNFSRSWKLELWTFVKLLLPILCLIIVIALLVATFGTMYIVGNNLKIGIGIIISVLYLACVVYIVVRSLLYALAQFIAIDNPEMTAKECVLKSQELMTGNRGNLFLLALSFIGWIILCGFTLYIGLLWLIPYMQVATICFYDRLKSK